MKWNDHFLKEFTPVPHRELRAPTYIGWVVVRAAAVRSQPHWLAFYVKMLVYHQRGCGDVAHVVIHYLAAIFHGQGVNSPSAHRTLVASASCAGVFGFGPRGAEIDVTGCGKCRCKNSFPRLKLLKPVQINGVLITLALLILMRIKGGLITIGYCLSCWFYCIRLV